MFFKNAKETTTSYTNSVLELLGILFNRYFKVIKDLWQENKQKAVVVYVGLFLVFVFSIYICDRVFNSQVHTSRAPASTQTSNNSNSNTNSFAPSQNSKSDSTKTQSNAKLDQNKSQNPTNQNLKPNSGLQQISANETGLKLQTLESRTEVVELQSDTLQVQTLADNQPVSNTIGDSVYQTIGTLKGIVQGFKPILDVFVSNTPDMAGTTTQQVNFASGSFDTAKVFSKKLMSLIFSIYSLFLILEGMILIRDINTKKQRDLGSIVVNHLFTIILLLVTPYILSYSILGVNAFCQYILGGKDLTSFLVEFLDKLQQGFKPNATTNLFDPIGILVGGVIAFSNPVQTIFDGFKAFLALFPVILIALMYILIIGQFVIRFIKLYFLAAIYPIIIIFNASPIKTDYVSRYWNSWITTLLHQAFFIFGYSIVQGFLLNMLNTGVGIEQIVILIGALIFLYNINSFSAEIIGGIVHRSSNAINAVIGDVVGGSIGAMLFGHRVATQGASAGSSGQSQQSGLDKREAFTGFLPSSSRSKSNNNNLSNSSKSIGFGNSKSPVSGLTSSTSPVSSVGSYGFKADTASTSHNQLEDPTQSKQAQAFSNQNYSVSAVDTEEGIIGVEGSFYAHNKGDGVSILYNSKQEALDDRVPASDIYPVTGKFNLQDTTNYAGRTVYEQRSGVELGVNASDTVMKQNLKQARFENKEKGVDGITTTYVSKGQIAKMKATGEKITKDTPRIQKTAVYTKNLNKSDNN